MGRRGLKVHSLGMVATPSQCKRDFCFRLGKGPLFTGNSGCVPYSGFLPQIASSVCSGAVHSTITTGVGVLHM